MPCRTQRSTPAPYIYKLTSGVVSAGKIKITGEHSRTTGGFVAGALNLNILTLNGNNSEVDGLFIDMSPQSNTAGAAIGNTAATSDVTFHDNFINQPFIGIDMGQGINQAAIHNSIYQVVSNGMAIRVGHTSTGANTIDPQILMNTMGSKPGSTGALAIRIEDAGGAQVTNNTVGNIGSSFKPGLNQQIIWGFFQGELGDGISRVPASKLTPLMLRRLFAVILLWRPGPGRRPAVAYRPSTRPGAR
jgi:hypothetical protein